MSAVENFKMIYNLLVENCKEHDAYPRIQFDTFKSDPGLIGTQFTFCPMVGEDRGSGRKNLGLRICKVVNEQEEEFLIAGVPVDPEEGEDFVNVGDVTSASAEVVNELLFGLFTFFRTNAASTSTLQ